MINVCDLGYISRHEKVYVVQSKFIINVFRDVNIYYEAFKNAKGWRSAREVGCRSPTIAMRLGTK